MSTLPPNDVMFSSSAPRGHRPFVPLASHGLLTPLRVFLLGDSLIRNDWVAAALESNGHDVEPHTSASECAQRLISTANSAVLIEQGSQPTDALGFVRSLSEAGRRRVLLLTWRPAWSRLRQFTDAGLADFVRMPTSVSEFMLRVELRARDALRPIAAQDSGVVPAEMATFTASFGCRSPGLRLTAREYRLLTILAERIGVPVSRSEILERVWGREPGDMTSNILDVYVRYLRVKLGQDAPHLVIKTVRRVGYSLECATSHKALAQQPG